MATTTNVPLARCLIPRLTVEMMAPGIRSMAMTTPLSTGVGEVVTTRPEDDLQTGEPVAAHIVKAEEGDATAKVLEARIYGTPVEALCGVVFVPQRDRTRLRLCSACKDIYDTYRAFNEGLPEQPQS